MRAAQRFPSTTSWASPDPSCRAHPAEDDRPNVSVARWRGGRQSRRPSASARPLVTPGVDWRPCVKTSPTPQICSPCCPPSDIRSRARSRTPSAFPRRVLPPPRGADSPRRRDDRLPRRRGTHVDRVRRASASGAFPARGPLHDRIRSGRALPARRVGAPRPSSPAARSWWRTWRVTRPCPRCRPHAHAS